MSHAPLAARYRPQTFAELVGQETVRSVLSRAAAEDRAAPAYLFSGTRGVGKTTLARVFAKALNCEEAPTGEPCNVCGQCRKITQGIHVDVLEIDGASNRGIEDARRLREHIGYAPLEARRKVFIIDEAHMLTRESFNALLKTLEEPPPGVTFILATTEAHKFPITIVSRCQHFIFQRLPEAGIEAHLVSILEREQVRYESAAVRLLARRAAGSVRDAMSLMGQTLALGGEVLSEQDTRQVLGLAGRELFSALLDAVASGDCPAVSALVRGLQDQGVDIGFFLRELGALWRNLFLLRQAGAGVLPALELPEEEGRELLARAENFSLAHIHAAWQMVLDAQRRVIHSLEPASALELLLLNLALLPRLVPVEQAPPPAKEVPDAMPGADAVFRPCPTQKTCERVQPDWKDFLEFCAQRHTQPAFLALPLPILRQVEGRFDGTTLRIACTTGSQHQQLSRDAVLAALRVLLREYGGGELALLPLAAISKSKAELKEEFSAHPLLQPLKEQFDAQLITCAPLDASARSKPTL
jgi:DNA polymerase-3 subunit gamma/tau